MPEDATRARLISARAEIVREIMAQEGIIQKARHTAEVGNLKLRRIDLQLEVYQVDRSIEALNLGQ